MVVQPNGRPWGREGSIPGVGGQSRPSAKQARDIDKKTQKRFEKKRMENLRGRKSGFSVWDAVEAKASVKSEGRHPSAVSDL